MSERGQTERTMSGDAVRIPAGVAVPDADRVYVSDELGHLSALDAATGELLATSDIRAVPLAAAGPTLVAVRAPTAGDPGEVVLVDATGDRFEIRWRDRLLDDAATPGAAALEPVDVAAELGDDQVQVTADVRTRYRGGAAASDDIIAAATTDRRHTVRFRRDDGRPLERSTSDVGAGTPTHREGDVAAQPAGMPNRWRIVDTASGRSLGDVELDDGTDEVAVVGDRVVYRVTETDGTRRRRYLRSRDRATGALRWSRLIDDVALAPRPPLPQ